MTTNEVFELIERLQKAGYRHMDVTHEGTHVILSDVEENHPVESVTSGVEDKKSLSENKDYSSTQQTKANDSQEETKVNNSKLKDGHVIESPIVGVVYTAETPESEPFVSVGSQVKKGQVLCIIEAMKLMNEIEADQDGVVSEILVENEQGVEFGQALFVIK